VGWRETSGNGGPRALLAAAWARNPLLVPAALLCAAVAALAIAAAALVVGYALVHAGARIAHGDPGGAARWATMTFFAGGPYIVAYAAAAGRRRCLRPAAPVVPGRRRAWAALALVALVSVGLQGVLAAHSYFTGDDWIHIVRAHDLVAGNGDLGVGYLGKVVFIHYAPGHRLGYWLLEQLAPLSWSAGLAAMLVLFVGSIVLLYRICTRLFGERRSNLLLVLLFGTSILLVTSFLWFADGMHKLPSTFLSLLAIDAYLTHREKGSRAALALAVAAVSLGSLFYVKVLLVPLYLVLIRLLFLEERPRRALRVLWAERWTWLAFAPTAVLYLLNYQLNYAHTRGTAPSLGLLGDYLWLNWFKGVTPALAGVEIGPHAARSGVLFATVAQLCLIGVIAGSIGLKRSAWRAWLFWGVAFTANATLVGLGRLGTMGLERVGSELRYDTEMAWLLPLALGFAFFPGDVAARPAALVRRSKLPWAGRRGARIGAVAAVCAYLVAAAATGSGISASWREHNSGPPQAYVEHLRRDVTRLARGGGRPVAIDDQVPAFLIGSADRPLNRLERLIPAIEPRLRVVVADPRPLQVGDDGHVGPAVLQPLVTGRGALAGAGSLRLVRGSAGARGGRVCLASSSQSPAAVRFASKPAMAGQSLYALVDYEVERRAAVAGSIASAPPSRPGRLLLDAPRGQELVNLGRPLHAGLPGGARVCVRSVAVGWLGSNGR
jgi:hypothetical protein